MEICLQGVWGSVCDDGWGDEDSLVACRQLGFNSKEGMININIAGIVIIIITL